ncbi:MAG: hypothetical protein AAGD34_00785 [Pseudomonadota bacterium]
MNVRVMQISDSATIPAILVAVVVGLALLAWIARGLRKVEPRGSRTTSAAIAAVQAERDVLRANHAVEIAALEAKLAEAQKRVEGGLDASLRVKESAHHQEKAEAKAKALETQVAELTQSLTRVTEERDLARNDAASVGRLTAERDRALRDVEGQSDTIGTLRAELQENINKLSRATADSQSQLDTVEDLTAQKDRAVADAAHHAEAAAGLRRDVQSLVQKLSQASGGSARAEELASDLEAAIARERALSTQLEAKTAELEAVRADSGPGGPDVSALTAEIATHKATIADLTDALSKAQSSAEAGSAPGAAVAEEVANLKSALEEANARERAANDSLSRLAYDRDGLRNRLEAAERTENDAKTEVEKREALLELRLQKIYELEGKLREQHSQLHDALVRAEAAEKGQSAPSDPGAQPEAPKAPSAVEEELRASIERLQAKLDQTRSENAELIEAVEEARAKGGHGIDIPALQKEIRTLKAQNADLVASAQSTAQLQSTEVEDLKAQLKAMADRFVAHTNKGEDEPSLADKIRAFKAARSTTNA